MLYIMKSARTLIAYNRFRGSRLTKAQEKVTIRPYFPKLPFQAIRSMTPLTLKLTLSPPIAPWANYLHSIFP
jgi:hypothetical protein